MVRSISCLFTNGVNYQLYHLFTCIQLISGKNSQAVAQPTLEGMLEKLCKAT